MMSSPQAVKARKCSWSIRSVRIGAGLPGRTGAVFAVWRLGGT